MNHEQIRNAVKALGLEGENVISLAIWDDRVVWETVEYPWTDDGPIYHPHEARIEDEDE